MVTSLSDLCAHLNAVMSLVVEVDRRQVTDRRKTRRGGRRADDTNPAVDPVDLRSVAIRRALTNARPPSISPVDESQADHRYVVAGRPGDSSATRRVAAATGRPAVE